MTSRISGRVVVARFKDGRMTHFTDFGDRDEALEAVGLSE